MRESKKYDEVTEEIDEWTADEEKTKTLTRQHFEDMLDKWCNDFTIEQPSQFFRDHPTNDAELVCSIQSSKDFLLQTLRFFGLPKGYLEGEGHFPDWGQKRMEDKRRGPKAKKKEKKQSKAASMYKKRIGKDKKDDADVKPTHFDIAVFLQSFKRFVACDGAQRSNARRLLLTDLSKSAQVFVDQHNDLSYKKVIDVHELPQLLHGQGEPVEPTLLENLGAILLCFGEIEHELQYGKRTPPETEEERRARRVAELKAKEAEEARKEAEADGEKAVEDEPKIPLPEPRKPIMMLLHLISVIDMKFCCQKMFEFDKVLHEMGIQKFDVAEEAAAMAALTKKLKRKFYDEDPVYEMPKEPSKRYSDNPEICAIVEKIEDMTTVPEAPESLQNAFAVTLFCMEAAFDSRSQDFLKYAFDAYPDRDYLIVTQPHTVVESMLLQKFTQPIKKTTNTFQHTLYIMHRDSLYNQDMYVERIVPEDVEEAKELIEELEEAAPFGQALQECAVNPASTNFGFVAKVMDQIVGCFVLSKDVNLDYYTSHFHIQDQILIGEQERKSHTRLMFSCINPIFEKSTRFMMKELLRLA